MAKIRVCNDTSQNFDLVIEPWATQDPMAPGDEAFIDYDDIGFEVEIMPSDGYVLVWVNTTRIDIRVGEAHHEYGTERPFPTLKRR